MVFFLYLSDFIIPVTILFIVVFACIKKVNIYDAFIEGAFDGLKTVVDILPTLIGLMVAVAVLRSSGFLSFLTDILKPFVQWTGFPAEIIPLSLMRLVSSSAATGLLVDLFTTYGTDSFIGRISSVMMSCTETVFYTMSVYFTAVKITKTRFTLAGAAILRARWMASCRSTDTLFLPTMIYTWDGPCARQAIRFPFPSMLTSSPSMVMAFVLIK